MKRIIPLLFLTLFLSSDSFSQFSAKGGINIAKFKSGTFTNALVDVSTYKNGILFGFNYKFRLSELASLRPGMQYSPKGNKVIFRGSDFSTNLNYLEVPIDFVYAIGRLSIHTGPYVAYLLTASSSAQNIKENMRPFDLGLNLGTAISEGDLGIGFNYALGLRTVSKNSMTSFFSTNKVLSVYLTYTH